MPVIKIVRLENGTVAFQPDDPPGEPGQHLEVNRGELIAWNNETTDAHWPWPTDAHGRLLTEAEADAFQLFLTNDIPGLDGSHPTFSVNPIFSPPVAGQPPTPSPPPPAPDVPPPRITYVCKHHQNEKGAIIVKEDQN